MIPGLDPVIFGAGYILAGLVSCDPQPMPAVTVSLNALPTQYSASQSSAELGKVSVDTKFSHGRDEVFVTGGLTESNIHAGFEAGFQKSRSMLTGKGCIWFGDISVTVTYAPVVFVSRDHAEGSCRYKEIVQHEARHVNTDVITINEYLPKIKKAVEEKVAELGIRGPLEEEAVEKAQSDMAGAIRTLLEKTIEEMHGVRMARQQLIDTRAEYLRLSETCR